MLYRFEDYALDTDRRELWRGTMLLPATPQVFDLLEFLIRNRERVVSKDDLVASVWETLIRLGWGEENAAFRQMFTSLFVPEGSKEQLDWFNELQRRTASPACAARYFHVVNDIDVRPLLSRVKAPTLVMHLREDAVHSFEYGCEIAAGIPDAHFVPLPGKNHMPLEHDPSSSSILDEIKRFLGVGSPA